MRLADLALVPVARLLLFGAAVGCAAVLTWWVGRAVAWLWLACFKLRRRDVRDRMRPLYRFLVSDRPNRMSPPVAAFYILRNAREVR